MHFGLNHPDRALSLVVGGCGYGAEADKRAEAFREGVRQEQQQLKAALDEHGERLERLRRVAARHDVRRRLLDLGTSGTPSEAVHPWPHHLRLCPHHRLLLHDLQLLLLLGLRCSCAPSPRSCSPRSRRTPPASRS